MSFGVSTSPFTSVQALDRPIFPTKKPCSKTTFCLALDFNSGGVICFPPISHGVYNIIPKPTFEYSSIFSIMVLLEPLSPVTRHPSPVTLLIFGTFYQEKVRKMAFLHLNEILWVCTFVSPKVPKGLARTMRLPALKKQEGQSGLKKSCIYLMRRLFAFCS